MTSLRRGVRSGDYGDGAPLRETRGPMPSPWTQDFAAQDLTDDDADLADGFGFTTIAPQALDSAEHAITREQYYRSR